MSIPDYEFQEDRTTYIKDQLLEDNEGTEAGKDISGADWSVKFRMYQVVGTLLLNVSLTKVAITGGDNPDTGGAKSGVEGYIKPVGAYGRVVCRYVLIDGATVDTATVSQFREYVWPPEWTTHVAASPQPA